MLDRNVWPKIVTTSQFLITMANEMLLAFIYKTVEIMIKSSDHFFFKENQDRELFYGLQDFIEIPNVAIEMFADFCEDFAKGTFIWFETNSLFLCQIYQ